MHPKNHKSCCVPTYLYTQFLRTQREKNHKTLQKTTLFSQGSLEGFLLPVHRCTRDGEGGAGERGGKGAWNKTPYTFLKRLVLQMQLNTKLCKPHLIFCPKIPPPQIFNRVHLCTCSHKHFLILLST